MKTRTRPSSRSSFTECQRVLSLAAAALWLFALSGQGASPLYQSVVIGDGPLAYYRFNDTTNRPNLNLNRGSLGSAGNATNLNTHLVNDRPINGSLHASTYFDSSARTIVPWTGALNPNASNDFTVEGWFNPSSDETFGAYAGPSPIMNRLSGPATNRQGWVFFQRSPDASYPNPDGVGWNFRTYTGVGSDVGVTVTSEAPYRLGEWQYVAVVWSGAAQTATMYINGTNAASAGNTSGDPLAYVANTDTNGITDPAVNAPNGAAGISIGAYNNTDPGSDAFMGSVADVAFYAKQLSPAQLLAHYQNATNASRTESYDALVESDGAAGYWRLDDLPADTNDVAVNEGSLQSSGMAINSGEVRHPAPSPLAGGASSSYGYHYRDTPPSVPIPALTDEPWNPANNPPASVPFTLEMWLRPMWDAVGNGQCPMDNTYVAGAPSYGGNGTGWVIYQRDPNATYSSLGGSTGIGWNFHIFSGTGQNFNNGFSGGQDLVTGVPYNIGEWQHFVVTWQPQTDLGPAANGTDSWEGTLTGYIDGVSVTTNSTADYCANTNPTEDGYPPCDFGIGNYDVASYGLPLGGAGGNGYEGEMGEVAFYNNYLLTTNQILAHYQAGTNAHPATNYATLVLTAAYDGAGTQGLQPASYFRLNEPAFYPVANSGSLGDAAAGSLVDTTNNVPGPLAAGFEATNISVPVGETLSGNTIGAGWVSLSSPAGLNMSNQLTMEAWILPYSFQGVSGPITYQNGSVQVGGPACIISYGPPIPSGNPLTVVTPTGIELSTNELFLSITNGGSDYDFGFVDGTNYHGVSYSVQGDLTNGQWVYLAGTYDGTTWRLFRNGQDVTNSTDAGDNLTMPPGSEWAIGSTGMGWADYFNGSIDEVAIYNAALSPATIQAHYYVAESGAVSLTITRAGGNVSINWPAGTLEQAGNLAGPWTDVPSATAPYQTSAGPGTMFYRVKL